MSIAGLHNCSQTLVVSSIDFDFFILSLPEHLHVISVMFLKISDTWPLNMHTIAQYLIKASEIARLCLSAFAAAGLFFFPNRTSYVAKAVLAIWEVSILRHTRPHILSSLPIGFKEAHMAKIIALTGNKGIRRERCQLPLGVAFAWLSAVM